jgi:hypothetical protein
VQNRYAADVGDLTKLGLVRHLAPPQQGGAAPTVVVNWHLAPDDGQNEDGERVAYLNPGERAAGTGGAEIDIRLLRLRPLDKRAHLDRSAHARRRDPGCEVDRGVEVVGVECDITVERQAFD